MIRTLALAICLLVCSQAAARAKDILLVRLQEDNGREAMHTQATSHDTCIGFLATFKRNRQNNIPTKLAFETEPMVNGTVLAAYCVLESGKIIDADGKPVANPS